jgi:transposase-like protein
MGKVHIYQMYTEGKTVEEICKEIGVTEQWTREVLRDYGVVFDTRLKFTTDELDAIREEWQVPGARIADVCALFSLSRHQAVSALMQAGCQIDPPDGRHDTAIELYLEGLSVKAIASTCGITPQTLYRELNNREIPTRRGRHNHEPKSFGV